MFSASDIYIYYMQENLLHGYFIRRELAECIQIDCIVALAGFVIWSPIAENYLPKCLTVTLNY